MFMPWPVGSLSEEGAMRSRLRYDKVQLFIGMNYELANFLTALGL
jgi:hypothetical protein